MGESRKLSLAFAALIVALLCPVAAASASPVPPPANPWLLPAGRAMNMAHQGGEMEAPSSTLYAFKTALADRGADTLEMDVNATSDDRLAVMHDYYLSKITPSSEQVRNVTLAQVQALDAGYWFGPGNGQFDHSLPADKYPLRGVRTGTVPPPDGYGADDFRVPSMEEVLAAFPDVPLNVEIKTVPGEPDESLRVAALLAEILNRPENRGRPIIVASLDQAALVRFHELAPDVDVSSSLTSMIELLGGTGGPIEPRPTALQVPNMLGEMDVPVLLKELDVAGMGFAVHAWTESFASENEAAYAHMLDSGVQGIMTSAPTRLAEYMCGAGVRRPDGSPRCEQQILKYSLAFPSRSLRTYLRSGLPVRARCEAACRLSLEVRMKPKEAKRLGIKGRPRPVDRGLVLIGTQRRVSGPLQSGNVVYRASVFRQAYKRLARVRRAKVEITVNVFDGSNWKQAVERRWVALSSPRPLKKR